MIDLNIILYKLIIMNKIMFIKLIMPNLHMILYKLIIMLIIMLIELIMLIQI